MKYIHNIIFIGCVCISNFTNAAELYTTEKLEVALETTVNQTIDKLQLEETQQKIVATLLKKQQDFEIRVYILAGIILLLVLVFGVLCFLNKRGDKQLKKIVSLLEKNRSQQKDNEEKNTNTQTELDETIVTAILENLQVFEKERGFLVSKITLYEFAKQLQTNTKYLSKVINTYKLKSFRNYINDLRIQYSIQKLENNTNYRKYTVKAMAKEVGFTTAESFTKAFQKKTGETVSSFLRQKNELLSE